MFHNKPEPDYHDLLDDPLIQTLMTADKVDRLGLEAMFVRIAHELKSRSQPLRPSCRVLSAFVI